jgi:NAD(P)-dependent dehydrogenase (short-subunit alcohol dehydrogenase family)
LVRLNAAKVIIACRNVDKGEAAKKDIESTNGARQGVVQVWSLDLGSFDSVRQFAARVDAELDRLDALIDNASVFLMKFRKVDDHEEQVLVNVISTLYLTVLILPVLRRSGVKHNVTPTVTIVSSDASLMVSIISVAPHSCFAAAVQPHELVSCDDGQPFFKLQNGTILTASRPSLKSAKQTTSSRLSTPRWPRTATTSPSSSSSWSPRSSPPP